MNIKSVNRTNRVYIISLNGTNNKGGVERVVQLVMNDLVRNDYDVILVDENRLIPRWLGNTRWNQFIFPLVASFWLWNKKKKSENFFTISNSSYTPFYPADVLIVHGSALGYVRAMSLSGKRFFGMHLLGQLEALSMHASQKNAYVSEYVKDLAVALHKVDPKKSYVINNGIDTSIFNSNLKFKENVTTIGFAGRLEFGKGLNYIIQIADWISSQSEYRFVIATIGKVPDGLQGICNITILRDVPPERMSEFYDQIDVLLLPSLFEGFELVTLEALASGVCVIGTYVGACRTFLDRGIPWVKKLPDSPQEFIELIPKIIKDFKNVNDPLVMREFINSFFSTEHFCNEIRSLMIRNLK